MWVHVVLVADALLRYTVSHALQILGISAAVLVAMGSKTDYASGFLDLVVYIMQQGCVAPALSMISQWAASGSADPLLVQHFVFRSLEVCAPPYSAHFTSTLLRSVWQAREKA